jgi:hypothetical protein
VYVKVLREVDVVEVSAGVVVVVLAIDVGGVVVEVDDDAMTELDSVEVSSGRIATGCVPLTLAVASRRNMLTKIRPFNMSVFQLDSFSPSLVNSVQLIMS